MSSPFRHRASRVPALRGPGLVLTALVPALGLTVMGPTVKGLTVLGPEPASAQTGPRVQTLRLPGLPGSSGSTEAHAVSAAGTIAGSATTVGGERHAVLWVNGTVVDLDRGRNGVSDTALAVNSLGHAVGQDAAPTADDRAVLWRDGRRTVLPSPPDSDSQLVFDCTAVAITDDDLVGGHCQAEENGSVNSIPIVWHDLVPTALWQYGQVNAIGPSGHRAGSLATGFDGEGVHAVLDTGTGPVTLPSLVTEGDVAYGINATDTVVGTSDGRPVVWSGGRVRALPAPSGRGVAYGVNRWGTVAGTERTAPRPVAWKKGALVPLGPSRGVARGVNDRGDVVGWSLDGSGRATAIRWHLFDGD